MTVATVIQSFCRRQGVPAPGDVLGSTDDLTIQLVALLEEECTALAPRQLWANLVNQCTFVTLAAESQGTLASLGSGPTAVNGLNYILPGTFWDRTQKVPVRGPLDAQDWQAIKAVNVTGPQYYFRLLGQGTSVAQLLLNPEPAAGHTMAFEYVTNNWCLQDGTTPASSFANNSDVILLPENIVLMGLRWRFKKEKNLPYAEDFDTYEGMVADAGAREGVKPVLHLDGHGFTPQPGIYVPSGNWPVP